MTGHDPADSATDAARHRAGIDYLVHLKKDALQGARLGVLRKTLGFHPDVDAAFERALTAMKAAGAVIVDAEIPTAGQWDEAEMVVLLHEFKDGLNRYLGRADAPVKSLAELIEFNRRHASTEMPWFGQELFEQAEATGSLQDGIYREAREKARRLAGPEGIEAALRAQDLDALLTPAMAPAWLSDPVLGDHMAGGGGSGAAAVAGTPSLTVPMGTSFGLPIGIVFMGPAWSEARLIELGYAFEQLTQARQAPRYLPTVKAD
jgi:amidase